MFAWLNILDKGVFCHSCLRNWSEPLDETNKYQNRVLWRGTVLWQARLRETTNDSALVLASWSETVIVHNNAQKRNRNKEVSKRGRRWKRETARLMSTEGEAEVWMIEFCHYCIWSCLISNNDSRCLEREEDISAGYISRIYLLFAVCQLTEVEDSDESQTWTAGQAIYTWQSGQFHVGEYVQTTVRQKKSWLPFHMWEFCRNLWDDMHADN